MPPLSRRAFLGTALALVPGWGAEGDLVPIFDGMSLDGWQQLNGSAKYDVEDGMIVGATASGSANSFLCTTKSYGDFVLQFEVRVESNLNSGVQIRSHRYSGPQTSHVWRANKWWEKHWPSGRVHGYQVEIANGTHASGGIFDEGERGWLQEIDEDPAASTAFLDEQWNKFRVAAMGDSVRTWVNGVPCADVVDPVDQSGFIGLQVHEYAGPRSMHVWFRNLRIADLGAHIWQPFALDTPAPSNGPDTTVRLQFKVVKGTGGLQFRGFEAVLDNGERVGQLLDPSTRRPALSPNVSREYRQGIAHYFKPGEWNELALAAHGSRIVVHVNGIRTADVVTISAAESGHLRLNVPQGSDVEVKDVQLLQPKQG